MKKQKQPKSKPKPNREAERIAKLVALIQRTPSPLHRAAGARASAGVMEATGRRRRRANRRADRAEERLARLE
jgi:hypothetical protein